MATTSVVAIAAALLWLVSAQADQFYSVRRGDTLTRLARRYDVTVAELAKRNNRGPQTGSTSGRDW